MKQGMNRREFLKMTGTVAMGTAIMPMSAVFAQAADAKDYIHIGCSLPLTSTLGKVAGIFRDAYQFYIETVNQKMTIGGKEYGIKLTIYDDENKPARTAELTEKLIVSDKVDLLLSSYGTEPTLAQASVCKKHKKVMLNIGVASGKVETDFVGTVFSLVGLADTYHRTLFNMIAKLDPPIKTVGIITPDDPSYHEMSKGVKEDCKKNGMEVVIEEIVPMNVSDLEPTVLKFKAKQPDMIVNVGWDKILAGFVMMAGKHNVKAKLLDGGHVTITPFLKDALGPKLKNICGVTFFMPEAKTKDEYYGDSLNFAKKYKEKYGYDPAYHAAMAYTVPYLFGVVLKNADPKDPFNPDFLRQSFSKMDMETLWGRVKFNEKGRIEKDMLVIQWQGDPPAPIIIYPPETAVGKLIYPSDPLGS